MDISRSEVGDLGVNRNLAVEERNFPPGRFRFGQRLASVGFIEKHLALQVAFFDEVTIDESESADAGACEQAGCGCSGGSAAHQRHMCGAEPFLSRFTDAVKEHLARVSIQRGPGRREFWKASPSVFSIGGEVACRRVWGCKAVLRCNFRIQPEADVKVGARTEERL